MKRPLKKLLKEHLLEEHEIKESKKYNEYPEIFQAVASHFQKMQEVKILSYGCQTGEECMTQKEYFDNYKITGMDRNKIALKTARAVNSDPNIVFVRLNEENIKEHGPYDVIFAMTVLCGRGIDDDTKDITEKYAFSKFEAELLQLNAQLKENGLLVIYNANFKFSESAIYDKYETVEFNSNESGKLPKFGKDNLRTESSYSEVIFRKKYTDVSVKEHES